MERQEIRELIRKAQAAEIAGETEQAATFLLGAAKVYLERGEARRAAPLLRHGLRLQPQRKDLQDLLARAEPSGGEAPDESVPGVPPGLVAPARGPILAPETAECWCSFCCRPKAEAGPMVAGPAGAFLCGRCAQTSAGLLGASPAAPPPPAAAAPAKEPAPAAGQASFIEMAVVLSKKLGWGLSELRALSPAELRQALEKLEELEDG